jgi:hypothetical protein
LDTIALLTVRSSFGGGPDTKFPIRSCCLSGWSEHALTNDNKLEYRKGAKM